MLPPPTLDGVAIAVGAEADPRLPVPPSPPALPLVAACIGRRVRVAVRDGRVLTGTLTCVDPQANLVLAEAVTLADDGGSGGGKDHPVGTVIVPAAQRASVGLEVEAHEERAWRDAVAGV